MTVRNLGKAYRRYPRKWGRIAEWAGLGCRHELAWVLRDISFTLTPGEAVGIVGANGAGKTTLLKVIAGTTRATTGICEVGGRVAALLELGIGFHPDFTGRQNAYMAGHIFGFSSDRVTTLMPDIEGFAEIGDYIDQPVRKYSSGMHVRLAFSIATAVRPEVLIVDEALSVGDAYFQHKSFDRIRRFRDEGTTLLFVSHSAAAVKTLCDRAILIDRGLMLRDATPDVVLDYYNALIAAHRADYEIRQLEDGSGRIVTRSGSAEATIESIDIVWNGTSSRALPSGSAAQIVVAVAVHARLQELTVGILIRDRLGNDVFGTNTFHLGVSRRDVPAGERLTIEFAFPSLDLGVGSYSITAALHSDSHHTSANFDWWDRALVFQVLPGVAPASIGVCALDVRASWDAIGLDDAADTAARSARIG